MNNTIPTREEALKILHDNVKTPNLIKHMLATEAFMKALARKFGEDEHKWGVAGLLHDVDWDKTKDNPDRHSLDACEMLTDLGIHSDICDAIKKHNDRHGIEPETLLEKALYTGETYTGFITACALVQPDKKLASVNLQSAVKKFGNKSFAAGASREIMKKSEELLNISVEEMIKMCLESMQGISGELGL